MSDYQNIQKQISTKVTASKTKIIVLDDDPTGTQTVHDVPVYTSWTVEVLKEALQDNSSLFNILTNSRGLVEAEARALAIEIGINLRLASEATNQAFTVVSRSDSTLRGHYPAEVDALLEGLEQEVDAHIIIPAFFEGGRKTIDDVHYIHEGETYTPVNETPFAQDAVFGYKNANLKKWVEEKTAGRIAEEDVLSIGLEDLREGGAERVAQKLLESSHKAVVVNAENYDDLYRFSLGLIEAEAKGKRYIYRTAASFVVTRAGLKKRELVKPDELNLSADTGGLIMVGSYVPLSTQQLNHLLANTSITGIELKVNDLLDEQKAESLIQKTSKDLDALLSEGKDAVVYTSRELVKTKGEAENLNIGTKVSQGLVRLLQGITVRPRYLIAKGGITSSDLATKGLHVQKALVKGQILAGVPVWQLGDEAKFPALDYVVFPGNVGREDAITILVQKLL